MTKHHDVLNLWDKLTLQNKKRVLKLFKNHIDFFDEINLPSSVLFVDFIYQNAKYCWYSKTFAELSHNNCSDGYIDCNNNDVLVTYESDFNNHTSPNKYDDTIFLGLCFNTMFGKEITDL